MIRDLYLHAKESYAKLGVDTDNALKLLDEIKISMQCWQGDDVKGFISQEALSGGISVTGSHPGAATNAKELRQDLTKTLSLIPGKHKINLHAIYADKKVSLDEISPLHFDEWIDWAKSEKIGLDFNPTCFSHPLAKSGFTISHSNKDIRDFWIQHCKQSRIIGEFFGKVLGETSIINYWFPDGYKDEPIDREAPRKHMFESLNEVFEKDINPNFALESIEGKLFGIGSESYVTGSNDFTSLYAITHGKLPCLDMGHYHPTENVSDKISTYLLFAEKIMLHISRAVRWDSDHVVMFDDSLIAMAQAIVRGNYLNRVKIALDYFDASINRIAAWIIGMRNTQKALLFALLEPTDMLKKIELEGDFTSRLALTEELKSMPFGAVYDYYCETKEVPLGNNWLTEVLSYEKEFLLKRGV